jgi:four helix bundle protein
MKRPGFARHPKLRDQLERAGEGPCANIAEGFGRFKPRDNARFVRVAAGSLAEIREHLSRARAHDLITKEEDAELESLTRRAQYAAKGYLRYLKTATPPGED